MPLLYHNLVKFLTPFNPYKTCLRGKVFAAFYFYSDFIIFEKKNSSTLLSSLSVSIVWTDKKKIYAVKCVCTFRV